MSEKKEKIAMVTGAAGFIGSHLTELLLSRGFTVLALDLLPFEKANNLSPVANHPRLKYTSGDIRNEKVIDKFFCKDASIIYHLASVVGVRKYMEDPMSLIEISIIGTKNILDKCILHDVRILFASTSEIYGKNSNGPWKEDYDRVLGDPSVDRWCYSTSKALVEHMLFGLSKTKKLKFSTVRFFNIYGPRQNPIFVVSQSIYRVLRNENPDLYDGGFQTRCFTYIDDVVDAIFLVGTEKSALGHVFNVGTDVPTKIKDVIELCLKKGNSDLKPNLINTQEKYGMVYQDIENRSPDISKIKDLLNWSPKTSIKLGIEKTINWVKENEWYLNDI